MSAASALAHEAASTQCVRARHVEFARFDSAARGLAEQERLADHLGLAQTSIGFVWRAPQALIVGRGDTGLRHFPAAAQRLTAEGWPVAIRRSGGSACPVSSGTIQVALARVMRPGLTIDTAYDELSALAGAVLASYGLVAEIGWRPNAYCAGRYDISVGGRKLAGLSQHWRMSGGRMTVTTALSLNVAHEPRDVAQVVNRFYQFAGGLGSCRDAAIGALTPMLPGFAGNDPQLLDDVSRRIVSAISQQQDPALLTAERRR